jgi:hypothetical protein
MQINTKFNVGDSVVFLHNNRIQRAAISRIDVSASAVYPSGVVTYYFDVMVTTANGVIYKYEQEIALTKEELFATLQEF